MEAVHTNNQTTNDNGRKQTKQQEHPNKAKLFRIRRHNEVGMVLRQIP